MADERRSIARVVRQALSARNGERRTEGESSGDFKGKRKWTERILAEYCPHT